ncbi:MAG: hypothetical protein ABFC79_03660 [Candidatus Cryosericum sp.]|nr:hypothetical protein [Candidatus Cryosericum sp.]HPS69275.1 hypothetical protein [Candidatus Cryosericum sp.]
MITPRWAIGRALVPRYTLSGTYGPKRGLFQVELAFEKETAVGYFAELFVLFVGRPAEGLRRVREHPSMLAAMIAILITGVADAVSFRIVDVTALTHALGVTAQVADALKELQRSPATFWAFLAEPFFLVLFAVTVIDGLARVAWKRSAASPLYASLGFAGLVAALLRMAGVVAVGHGGVLALVFSYGAMAYSLVVGVWTVKLLYEKNAGLSLLAYLLPLLIESAATLALVATVGGVP